jgi:cytidylate kinase
VTGEPNRETPKKLAAESRKVSEMKPRGLVIAIDGPSGAGKTTMARQLARRLDYTYLDTGATFRAVAWKALEERVDIEDPLAVAEFARRVEIRFGGKENERVFLDDFDVTTKIRTPEVSKASSRISAYPEVRQILTEIWRQIGKDGGVVMEGRDIGTVVFPDADLKFYLVARLDVRAMRRYLELGEACGSTLEQVATDMAQRDEADSTRQHAPLTRALDAIEVDSSEMTIDETAAYLERVVKSRMNRGL